MISTLLDSVELSGSLLSTREVTKGLSCMTKENRVIAEFVIKDLNPGTPDHAVEVIEHYLKGKGVTHGELEFYVYAKPQ